MLYNTSLPTSLQVDQNVPAFVRENHGKFVQFLTNYYAYLDQNENINDYIRNVISFMDVDKTTEYLLNGFFEELKELPYAMVVDKRLLAKNIIDLYASKGSMESFHLLFRILFNEKINVIYPSESILRASDGVWVQDYFFELTTTFGSLNISNTLIDINYINEYGSFKIRPSRIESVESTVYRVHYDSRQHNYIRPDQEFFVFDSDGVKQFVGKIRKAPSKLAIDSGGAGWQIGTIITIPGTINDTIARVTRVGPGGSITGMEIIEYGYGHTENQILIVSPYPNRPTQASTTVTKTLITFDPLVYEYVVDINDYTNGIDESVNGVVIGTTGPASYFAENYASDDYAGVEVINTLSAGADPDTSIPNDENTVTLEEWLASRATLVMTFDYLTKERGEYTSDRGQLSNSEIRLQDGLYYQLFSYVIQTTRNVEEYKQAIALIHPAGTKFFSESQNIFTADVSSLMQVTRVMSQDKVYINDVQEIIDAVEKIVGRPLEDSITMSDVIASKVFGKSLEDSVVATDGIDTKEFTKGLNDIQVITDATTVDFGKSLEDSAVPTDQKSFDMTKGLSDTVTPTDTLNFSANKYLTDVVTASQTDITTREDIVYAAEDFFAESYTLREIILTTN